MYAIGFTVTHCRFEATDPESDEVVLMKILHVLLACVRGAAGRLLSDDMIYEMVQVSVLIQLVITSMSLLLHRLVIEWRFKVD